MALNQLAFMAAMLCALTIAFARGGWPERLLAGLLLPAALVSPLVFDPSAQGPQWKLALLDVAVLAGMRIIAIKWPRRWLDHASAFQLLAVLTHFAYQVADASSHYAYAAMLAFWAYPVLGCLTWGAWQARRLEPPASRLLAGHGEDLTARPFATQSDRELATQFLYRHGLGPDAAAQADALLQLAGTLPEALATPPDYLLRKGIDPRTVEALGIARELNDRMLSRAIESGPVLSDSAILLDYLHGRLAHLRVECFHVLFLDVQSRLIARQDHSTGTATASPVFARQIMHDALELGAARIILAHNHPSGNSTPSREDIAITRQLRDLFRPLGITLVDHLILTSDRHFSLAEAGFI